MSDKTEACCRALGIEAERQDRCHKTGIPHVCDPGALVDCDRCVEMGWREKREVYPTGLARLDAYKKALDNHEHVFKYGVVHDKRCPGHGDVWIATIHADYHNITASGINGYGKTELDAMEAAIYAAFVEGKE